MKTVGVHQELQEADRVLFSSFRTKSVHFDPLKGPLNTSGLDRSPKRLREVVSPNESEGEPSSLAPLGQ